MSGKSSIFFSENVENYAGLWKVITINIKECSARLQCRSIPRRSWQNSGPKGAKPCNAQTQFHRLKSSSSSAKPKHSIQFTTKRHRSIIVYGKGHAGDETQNAFNNTMLFKYEPFVFAGFSFFKRKIQLFWSIWLVQMNILDIDCVLLFNQPQIRSRTW